MTEKNTQIYFEGEQGFDSEENILDTNEINENDFSESDEENLENNIEEIDAEEERNILEGMTEEEIKLYEEINEERKAILELALSEDPTVSRKATYSAISTSFADVILPEEKINEKNKINKLIKTKYQVLVASILFSVMPLVSEAQHKQDKKEIRTENVFDASTERMAKQIFGWHKREREMYIALETQRKILYQRLYEIRNSVPLSESQKSMYRMLEAKRDAELAKIEAQEKKINEELINSNMSDPVVIAEAEADTRELEYLSSKAINEFERQVAKVIESYNKGEVKNIEKELREIEQNLNRLVRNQITHVNSTYYWH